MFPRSLTRRRVLVGGVAAGFLGSLAGCSRGSGGSNRRTVTMTDGLDFDPETVRIDVGTTVVWENPSSSNHTVTAVGETLPESANYFASGGFDSESAARNGDGEGLVAPDETYSHTFRVPGEFDYVCLPHETTGMTGTVVVEEGGES